MKVLITIVSVIAFLTLFFFIAKLVQSRPKALGLRDGQLLPCPESPNCVSTVDNDKQHGIAPMHYQGDKAEAYAKLRAFVNSQENTRIYEENPEQGYLRVEVITPLMRFVDDVEFLLQDGVVHFRSASRFGYGDMELNRQRMEMWRQKLEADLVVGSEEGKWRVESGK